MDQKTENSNDLSISETDNDIAIIGMSCRYPGEVNSPKEFWEFLLGSGDGIVDVPADRWDNNAYFDPDKDKPNRMYVNRGGFISAIEQFDPQFFNISPKEAPHIDPQHRWLLELTQEAFENAGIKVSELKGSDTAVYLGQFMHDYEQIQLDSMAHNMMSSHSATGPSMTLTANRISYAFDFTGPSVTLDTACSSSLVALDMACKAILSGDSQVALAGGVNILLRPELTMSICKASMLSPEGQCKSFDAAANGYVRSEGAGLILVKKLSEAQKDGDKILAVIKATGVNQDGQTIGITVPNGTSQQKLLLQSLRRANLDSAEIQYAEAHGTGTAVGDPIEVNALGGTLGARDHHAEQCVIGSVKSNIGHTEAAAGVAGLIKTVMSLGAGIIPKNIHYYNTNPAIDLEKLNVRIADKQMPWPDAQGKPRRAIVNSFGFGGTNANVILEQAPANREAAVDQKPLLNSDIKLLPISSKTEKGLRDQAEKYLSFLEQRSDMDAYGLHDVCYSAAIKRDHYKHRLVVTGETVEEFKQGLQGFARGNPSTAYVNASVKSESSQKICFVFSGMGTTWAGMAKQLYQVEPVFKAMLDRCNSALFEYGGWSLLDAMFNVDDVDSIYQTYLAQPAIFASQVSLAALLESWGITPSCIVGHSAGEVAAAYVAGVYSFEDAIKVIYQRSRLQHTTEGSGKMLAVALTEEALQPYLIGFESQVSIAAINSEDALTLSGDEAALSTIAETLDLEGIFSRFLKVGVPYHSQMMDQLKEPLIAALQGIQVNSPKILLYSTVSGKLTQDGDWEAEYWPRNVREPVLFKAAIDSIAKIETNVFLEIAPHAALSSSIKKNLEHVDGSVVIATMKREQNDVLMLMHTLGLLHANGMQIDWSKLYPNGGNFVMLPNYAWQHAAYWHESEEVQQCRLKNISKRGGFFESSHPLLGARLNSTSLFWQNVIDLQDQAYIADHQVEEEVIYPGAAYVEMVLSIADSLNRDTNITLENIEFKRAFFLDKEKPTVIESTLDPVSHCYTISAVDTQAEQWEVFSEGVISEVAKRCSDERIDLVQLKASLPETKGKSDFYQHCHKLGLSYQTAFQAVEAAWHSDNDALVEIQLPASLAGSIDEYLLHPSILDGAFQSLFPTIDSGFLPVKIGELHYYKKPGLKSYCHLVTRFKDDFEIKGDLTLFDEDGSILVEIRGVELKSSKTQMTAADDDSILYDYSWEQQDLGETGDVSEGLWIIFADASGHGSRLAQELEGRLQAVCLIESGDTYKKISENHFSVNMDSTDDVVGILNRFSSSCHGIVYLWGMDNQACESLSAEEVLASCQHTAITPMYLAQALSKVEWGRSQKVSLVTRSAQSPDNNIDSLPQPTQLALWGFGRVLASEHPEYAVSMVDLSKNVDDKLIVLLANEVLAEEYEQEVALRNASRYVNRLRKLHEIELNAYARFETPLSSNAAFQVSFDSSIKSENKYLLTSFTPSNDIASNSVEIKVSHIGVDPRSIEKLKNVGNIDSTKNVFDCAGVITRIGSEVGEFLVGDEVIAFTNQGLSSIIATNTKLMLGKPANASGEQGAGLLSAFLTAYYALEYLAGLRDGESVLIHEAADSAGLAAIQLAQNKNATIYVTAGSQEKRDHLYSLGLENVYSSGDFDFITKIIAETKGQGVDIVLNTLSGQFVSKTIGLMRPFGRFVELRHNNTKLSKGLLEKIFDKNISCHVVNLAELINQRADLVETLLAEISGLFSKNCLAPLPINVFSVDKASDAFSSVLDTQAEGRLVLDFNVPDVPVIQGMNEKFINDKSSYLVTGGLGGLGLEIMQWLADNNAQSIVLTGRRSPSDFAQQAIERVRNAGVDVHVLQADVTEVDDVSRIIASIEKDMLPLAGIIHSAGVLDDGTITQQTADKFHKVLAPKVKGAWNLHQQTNHIDLDFFVCFSSIAAVVGWAGQSNYAAANAFMDGLAHHRRAQGKSALSINWGPWGGSGMAANLDERDIQRMNDAGMEALSPEQGLAALSQLLAYRVPQAGVFDLNWSRIFKQFVDPSRKTVFKNFVDDSDAVSTANFIDVLISASADQRKGLLAGQISELLADVLGIENAEGVDKGSNVFEYGLNSLMAMDFKNRLQRVLAVNLPGTLVLKYPTVNAMVTHLMDGVLLNVLSSDAGASIGGPVASHDVVPTIKKGGDKKSKVLSYAQQRLWLIGQIEEINAQYNLATALRMQGSLNIEALQRALNTVVDRHEILRTTYTVDQAGKVEQVIQDNVDFRLAVLNLSHFVVEEQNIEIKRLAEEEAARSFDLSMDLMLRAALLTLGKDDYVLFMTMHHIASDGWSKDVLVKEIHALYSAYSQNQENPLVALEIQYADYAYWQRNYLQGEELERQLGYWKEKLDGIPAVHNLPLDRPRPTMSNYVGETITQTLDISLQRSLNELATAQGVTLFMLLHAAFVCLLGRHSGSQDIVIGTPIANREQAEIAPLLGFFVNNLVLRSDLSSASRFIDLLEQSKATLLGAYEHQQTPFELLVDELQPERSLNHSPIFQIMLALQNNKDGKPKLPGLEISAIEGESKFAKFDLMLDMVEHDGGSSFSWEYAVDIFDTSTVERLAKHFEVLLQGVVANPTIEIGCVPLLTEQERAQFIDWNNTVAPYPEDQCIHELFEAQVERTPDALAVTFNDQRLTYRELNEQANNLADYLCEQGIMVGALVGICTERSLEMVVGLLGVLKAGGAYVPLDPAYPAARLEYMLEDSAIEMLITQKSLLDRLQKKTRKVFCLEDLSQLSNFSSTNISRSAISLESNDLAYIIYTSGSTGNPKGVMIEHRNAVALLAWAKAVYSSEELVSVLASTSICFDLSVYELFLPLSVGGSIVVVQNILALQESSFDAEISLINTVPSAIKSLLDADAIPRSVKTINLAGELLKQEVVDKIYEKKIDRVCDLYGPSEDTTYSTYAERVAGGSNTIGKPISNTVMYVLNSQGQLCPIGVAGELYIGGAGLSRGYLNRQDLTDEKFIPNPFSDKNAERLYKTGDLVCWSPNGNLEYLGRMDHQVKIRGFRIELGEIEAALLKCETIREAVVVARDEPQRLVAYIVLSTRGHEDLKMIQELREYLSEALPDYMLPSVFVLLEKLPLTPNGKIDRKSLPLPDMAEQLSATYVAPETDIEKTLCEIWQKLLELDQVGVKDNFFEIGGNSLLAVQLVSRITSEFEINITVADFFMAPLIKELSKVISTKVECAEEVREILTVSNKQVNKISI